MGFRSALRVICAKLKAIYGIHLDVDPCDFLADYDTLSLLYSYSPCSQSSLDPSTSQVLVHVADDGAGESHCDIALYFPDRVQQGFASDDPLGGLRLSNLDSLWQVIEELSHFLLIATRCQNDLSTSMLELEWQGEIDKVLIAAQVLAEQHGKSQALDLAALLNHHCRFTSADAVYEQAQFLAQKFWYTHQHALDNHNPPAANEALVARLRSLYPLNWHEKLRAIA